MSESKASISPASAHRNPTQEREYRMRCVEAAARSFGNADRLITTDELMLRAKRMSDWVIKNE